MEIVDGNLIINNPPNLVYPFEGKTIWNVSMNDDKYYNSKKEPLIIGVGCDTIQNENQEYHLSKSGGLFWAFFKVKDNAEKGSIFSFNYTKLNVVTGVGFEEVPTTITPVSFKVGSGDRMLGDVNGNNKIDIGDYMLIVAYTSVTIQLDEESKKAADVTGDGRVSITDMTKMFNYIRDVIQSLED